MKYFFWMAVMVGCCVSTIAAADDCGCTGIPTPDIQVATMTMTLASSSGGFGYSDGLFHSPAHLGAYSHSFFVADLRNRRIQRFRDTGTFEFTAQSIKDADGNDATIQAPFSLAIDPRGAVYVGDLDENVIYRFDTYGQYQATIGAFGGFGVKFNQPMGLAVDVDGYLWVADSGNSRILKLDEQGKKVLEIGSVMGRFSDPVDVWVDPDRQVWVLDSTGLKAFDEFGRFKRQVIYATGASSVTRWANDYWVLTFPESGEIKIYATSGEYLQTLNDPLVSPIDAMTLSDNRLLVSDRGTHRIWLFVIH